MHADINYLLEYCLSVGPMKHPSFEIGRNFRRAAGRPPGPPLVWRTDCLWEICMIWTVLCHHLNLDVVLSWYGLGCMHFKASQQKSKLIRMEWTRKNRRTAVDFVDQVYKAELEHFWVGSDRWRHVDGRWSTNQSIDQMLRKLGLAGGTRHSKTYVACQQTLRILTQLSMYGQKWRQTDRQTDISKQPTQGKKRWGTMASTSRIMETNW